VESRILLTEKTAEGADVTDLERYISSSMSKLALDMAKLMPWFVNLAKRRGPQQAGRILRELFDDPAALAKARNVNLGRIGIEAADFAEGKGLDTSRKILTEIRKLSPSNKPLQGAYDAFRSTQRAAAQQRRMPLKDVMNWMSTAQESGMGAKNILSSLDDFIAGKRSLNPFVDSMGVPIHGGVDPSRYSGRAMEGLNNLKQLDRTGFLSRYRSFNPDAYAKMESEIARSGRGGIFRRTYQKTPKWLLGLGAGAGGFGLANMLAQPRVDAAKREGFGQATGQMTPLIQGMYNNQAAWRLPPYAQG
jgi:hypothetical protein